MLFKDATVPFYSLQFENVCHASMMNMVHNACQQDFGNYVQACVIHGENYIKVMFKFNIHCIYQR